LNWLIKLAGPEKWLRQQGIPEEIIQYALDDNKFPRKIQKWVAVQLGKEYKQWKSSVVQDYHGYNIDDEFLKNYVPVGDIIVQYERLLIEVRDWYNYMSRTQQGFDINNFNLESVVPEIKRWQELMEEERGEGHARYYSEPDYNSEDLGDGFKMVEVVPEDLKNEGAIMQHCVGDDDQEYAEKVERGKSMIFSLRDAHGWPHVTIEVENQAEFDIKDFDNDPENWVYDNVGNLVDIDYSAYNERSAEWSIIQIQGKQDEPPIDKYRPYVRQWLQEHPEYNPTENDFLMVTPSSELLQKIVENSSNLSNKMYAKYSNYLSEEDQVRLFKTVMDNNGEGWSADIVKDAINKPIINGWFGEYEEEFPHNFVPGPLDRKQYDSFVGLSTKHKAEEVRRSAYSRMIADGQMRTPEGIAEFQQIALQEPSAMVVAAILPSFFTYPNAESDDPMKKYRNPFFDSKYYSFAMQLSEKFKGQPRSHELHSKLIQGLSQVNDPQVIAQAIANMFIGQRPNDIPTYEMRDTLEKMDSTHFAQVWPLLDPRLRKILLYEDARSYAFLSQNHKEVLNQYPDDIPSYDDRSLGNPPVGVHDVYQPPEPEPELKSQYDLSKVIAYDRNWLRKIIAQSLRDEAFIDDSGEIYFADGDIGPNDHDTTVLETVLGSSLEEYEQLPSIDPMDLNEDQWRRINDNFPGFIEYVAKGGLPKEYAVLHMGWIRVLGNTFEIEKVTEAGLNHVANYVHDVTEGNPSTTIYISDRSNNKMIPISLEELEESLQQGQAAMKIYMLSRRPQGLY